MTKNLKKFFKKKELEFMFDVINRNCNPVFDNKTEKQRLTHSILDKLQDIAFENNYHK
tara:strand:+ start:292 stop:465 length:174 start_codon:yes stop_codon:yes gene_type:complete